MSMLKERFDVVTANTKLPYYCCLLHEEWSELSAQTVLTRMSLLEQFRDLDPVVFKRLRHFQPQSGCFNKCTFCSQGASSRIVEFTKDNLNDLIAVIKAVTIENAIKEGLISSSAITLDGYLSKDFVMPHNGLIANERTDRAGVVYLYLDNDPALYVHLSYVAKILFDNLGVKSRIATVGYSRHNEEIDRNFVELSTTHSQYVAGIRLSISPYTYGWTDAGGRVGLTSREEFEADMGHFLSVLKPLFIANTMGRKGVCAELRFKPLVVSTQVNDTVINGHFVLHADQYLYISVIPSEQPPIASLLSVNDHGLGLSNNGIAVVKVPYSNDWRKAAMNAIEGGLSNGSPHTLHTFMNDDGVYFGVDVERNNKGYSFAKYFYPKTTLRPGAGYIDGERYLLNQMLSQKAAGKASSWDHVSEVFSSLRNIASSLVDVHPESAKYINQDVLPLIESYARSLKLSGFDAKYFFDKNMTVDTGHICNLGNAYHEYKSIASRTDLPLTPNHERTFGLNGDLAREGTIYRLTPGSTKRKSSSCATNRSSSTEFMIEALDMTSTASDCGQSKKHYLFTLTGIQTHRLSSFDKPIIIGQIPVKNIDD